MPYAWARRTWVEHGSAAVSLERAEMVVEEEGG